MAESTYSPETDQSARTGPHGIWLFAWRLLAWVVVITTGTFLLNNYLTFWRDWPGAFENGGALSFAQLAIYIAGFGIATILTLKRSGSTLRADAAVIYRISAYFIRTWFWIAIFVGVTDMVISFLRVEQLLPALVGDDIATKLGRSVWRGQFVHLPLIALAMVVAAFTRTLGFHWLALLVVLAELQIVIGRFIFSYEQALMGDIVRFWYAGLFLFASAYTLIEEGHVRVDVAYAGFKQKRKGMVNAIGSVLLGISLCIVILMMGMESKASVINSALLKFEVSQSGFGMYIKYLMAGFLGVFAISMMLQFAGYMLEGVADWRGDPDKRQPEGAPGH